MCHEQGWHSVGLNRDPARIWTENLSTLDRIVLRLPLSDRISDLRSDGPRIHRIVFGSSPPKVGSDTGRIEFGTGLSDYPVMLICDRNVQ